ncbi:alpha-amylase family glycosyl hydrolase [Mucilaginibacter sp.]|jgi:1,4-alpha-glucan branching enzyme|uniref:alpha-amylase family glycosyl hydrolase n=1 Tax=Mucilaginibacter sp. TaxID=1882438 RepID=UPI002BF552A8|nr:alpha-amylase family glycosyl hydrolase [Mucilaginibacter sp.]HTI60833.1 alpha-amylase family glycosyl hydrolase [Mucilaginibacter sp.]
MKFRNLYLLLMVVLLIGGTACKKSPKNGDSSGNVTGNQNGVDPPAGSTDGVTFINAGKSVIFNLYAPKKKSVSVVGEFNGWAATAMKNSKDGNRWWVQVDNLDPSREYAYQYVIDGTIKVADPYTEKVLDPDNDKNIPTTVYPNLKAYPSGATGIVSTFWYSQPTYSWTNTSFTRPDPKNLVIYELLVRDFVATHDYKTIKDTLNYFKNLGVNAIELMPVNEFEGNDSWGYNPNFYFAPDKYYGTKNDLKALIDACHSKGIAVVQDIVLNHSFGSSPMVQMYWNGTAPSSANPWYNTNPTHPYNVGFQFNHESAATKTFVKNVLKWWIQEYHVDGFRFDLAKGFTQFNSGSDVNLWGQYDASRVAIWKDYNSYMLSLDPKLYVILEDFASPQEESELANQGMMTWQNLSGPAEQALMSYNDAGGSWDFSGIFYDQMGFTNPYALVTYFESHDEERLQYKNGMYGNASGSYSIKDLATGLKRDEMGAAFMFSSPGPKMVWQFGERGYDFSINNFGGRLSDKPPHWEYMADADRHHLYATYAKMIKWKINNAVFTTTNFHYGLSSTVKYIQLIGTDNNVEVVGNFGVTSQTANVPFPAVGTYIDNFTGATFNVTALPMSMTLAPGEYHVYSTTALH